MKKEYLIPQKNMTRRTRWNKEQSPFLKASMQAAILLSAFTLILSAGCSNIEKTASIAVPSEFICGTDGYETAWKRLLPDISREITGQEISIIVYNNFEELLSILCASDKNGLLWAEIPISAEFDVQHNELRQHIRLIEGIPNTTNFIRPLLNLAAAGSTPTDGKSAQAFSFIPLTMDPYFMYTAKSDVKKSSGQTAVITLAAKTDREALAAYSWAKTYTCNSISGDSSIETQTAEAVQSGAANNPLHILSVLNTAQVFQKNAYTYNRSDAVHMLLSGKAQAALMSLSELRKFGGDDALNQLKMMPFPDFPQLTLQTAHNRTPLILDATAIIFPKNAAARKSRTKYAQQFAAAVQFIASAEIQFAIADSRGTMPANISAPVRDRFSENALIIAAISQTASIPAMPGTAETNKEVAAKVRKQLAATH